MPKKSRDYDKHAEALCRWVDFFEVGLDLAKDALLAAENEDEEMYVAAIAALEELGAPEKHDFEVTFGDWKELVN